MDQRLLAALVVAVVVLVLYFWVSWRRPDKHTYAGLLTGVDNRRSTGKLIALLWSGLVAWMVLTEAFIAIGDNDDTFADLLAGASDLYFVLLGGPYAAAVFAKISIQTKVDDASPTLTPPMVTVGVAVPGAPVRRTPVMVNLSPMWAPSSGSTFRICGVSAAVVLLSVYVRAAPPVRIARKSGISGSPPCVLEMNELVTMARAMRLNRTYWKS